MEEKLAAEKSKAAALEAQVKSNKGPRRRRPRWQWWVQAVQPLRRGARDKCAGDLICKEVPTDDKELPDHLDRATNLHMVKSSYKKVCPRARTP